MPAGIRRAVFWATLVLCVSVVPTVQGGTVEPAVVETAKAGDVAALRAVLKRSPDANAADVDGTTALHWAAYRDDLEKTDLLLRAGANARAVNRFGVTPLALAAERGGTAVVDRLLRAGADANTTLPGGETALMTASRAGHA